jgi:glycosyltransferase involved in cell wall biosynthesis
MPAAEAAGILDRNVFLLEGWVPYERRGAYLAEADIGVSAHRDTAETRYAWRTRLLDYAWARLPVAATSGDALSERLAAAGAAELAAPGDVAGFAAAMRALATDAARRQRAVDGAAAVAEELRWPRVAAPLVDWVARPTRTADAVSPLAAGAGQLRMYAAKGWHTLREEGPAATVRRAGRYRDRA